jgi:hypothetical protein
MTLQPDLSSFSSAFHTQDVQVLSKFIWRDGGVANDILDRGCDGDETLTDRAWRFIDRHVTPGEKRPPAPSERRKQDQTARKKA